MIEGQGLSLFKFTNGVLGELRTGFGIEPRLVVRAIGTDGTLELGNELPLRMWGKGQSEWTNVPVEDGIHGLEQVALGVLDLVDALKHGREPELSARRALRATELIFATYESSRRRGRVDLPLTIDDSPFLSMVEAGMVRQE